MAGISAPSYRRSCQPRHRHTHSPIWPNAINSPKMRPRQTQSAAGKDKKTFRNSLRYELLELLEKTRSRCVLHIQTQPSGIIRVLESYMYRGEPSCHFDCDWWRPARGHIIRYQDIGWTLLLVHVNWICICLCLVNHLYGFRSEHTTTTPDCIAMATASPNKNASKVKAVGKATYRNGQVSTGSSAGDVVCHLLLCRRWQIYRRVFHVRC